MKLFVSILFLCLSLNTIAQDIVSGQRLQSVNYQKGVAALNDGQPELAYKYLNTEIMSHPDNGYAHCYMAFVCNYFENPKLALQAIDFALKYIPESDKQYRSLAHYTRGMIFLNHKQWLLAESDFNDAILDNPTDAENYLSRAQVYMQTDRWEEALDDVHRALSLDKTISVDRILEQFNESSVVAAQ